MRTPVLRRVRETAPASALAERCREGTLQPTTRVHDGYLPSMASRGSTPLEAWAALLGEVLGMLLGLWMISRGWDEFGATLVVICAVGFVVSSVHLVRVVRRRPSVEEETT